MSLSLESIGSSSTSQRMASVLDFLIVDGNDNFVEKVDLAEDNEYTQFKLNFDVVKQREIIDEK